MDLVFAVISLVFATGFATDYSVTGDSCALGLSCSASRSALIQQRAGGLHGDGSQLKAVPSERSEYSVWADEYKDSEKMIPLNDGLPDVRAMDFRSWTLDALSKLPEQHLEARRLPGQWDHKCDSSDEMESIRAASPRIPRHIHFTLIKERAHWVDKADPSRLLAKGSSAYNKLKGDEQLLIENMRYTIAVSGMESIHFLDDDACRQATEKWSPALMRRYEDELDLRYKTDICRVAALYWEGGYYFDDDMVTYEPVKLRDDTDFSSAVCLTGTCMFQSFLAASPCHPVLKRNLELFLDDNWMESPAMTKEMLQDVLLGPTYLYLAFKEVKPSHAQLLHEVHRDPLNTTHGVTPDRNGHACDYVVSNLSSSTMHFCSRI